MEKNFSSNYRSIHTSIADTDFTILFSPKFQANGDDWNTPEHFHFLCECHLLLSGSIRLTTQDENYIIKANTFCAIPQNMKHSIKTLSSPTRKLSFYVAFSQIPHIENKLFPWYEIMFTSDKPLISTEILLPFNELFNSIVHNTTFSFISEYKLKHMLSLLLLDLAQHTKETIITYNANTAISYDHELILEIENFLIENFQPTVQLEDLAEFLGLSQRQTIRLLRRLFNQTFHEIKATIRITKAKELISQNEHSLKDISSILGYDSYIGFYKSFRNSTGATPEEYKKTISF